MEEGKDILFTAIEHGRTSIIQAVVNKVQSATLGVELTDLLKEKNKDSLTPLHLATELGHVDIVRALLEAGADPCAKDSQGRNPYQLAKEGSSVRDAYTSEIFQAVGSKNTQLLTSLLAAGVPVDVKDSGETGNTLLHWASTYSTTDIVQLLCEQGASVNVVNSRGESPLHDAVVAKSWSVVEELLHRGADQNIIATSGPHSGKSPKDLLGPNNWDGQDSGQATPVQDGVTSSTPDQLTTPVVVEGSYKKTTEELLEVVKETEEEAITVAPLDDRLKLLCPSPRTIVQFAGDRFTPDRDMLTILVSPNGRHKTALLDMMDGVYSMLQSSGYAFRIQSAQKDHFVHVSSSSGIVVFLVDSTLFSHSQAYRIIVNMDQVIITGASPEGAWYGLQTFIQLLKLFPTKKGIPILTINDWPDMCYRAVMLDLSYGKHLSLEVLKYIVDILSYLKYNQLQLRFENNFAYYGHSKVWEGKEPYNSSELTALECYCSRQYISLIPYQDGLSHFEEWLQHNDYADLGEFILEPDGENQSIPSASCLCPIVGNRKKLLADLYFQLQANFSSKFMNAGLDITTEFASWRSSGNHKANCFSAHLKVLQQLAVHHGKTLQCWSSGFHQYPSLLRLNHALDCVLLEPITMSDDNFEKRCQLLSDSGHTFYVCPSTMGYNSIAGDISTSLPLIERAVRCGQRLGAMGMMLCDWTEAYPLHSLSSSLLPFAAAAALSWNTSTAKEQLMEQLPAITNIHMFQGTPGDDGGLGDVLTTLSSLSACMPTRDHMCHGRLPSTIRVPIMPQYHRLVDCDVFYGILLSPDLITVSTLDVVALKKCMKDIRSIQTKLTTLSSEPEWLKEEIVFSIDMLLLAAKIIRAVLVTYGKGSSVGTIDIFKLSLTARTDIANSVLAQRDRYAKLWDLMGKSGNKEQVMSHLKQLTETLMGKALVD